MVNGKGLLFLTFAAAALAAACTGPWSTASATSTTTGDGTGGGVISSEDCVSCHQPDYDATSSPVHAGFPTTCTQCHTETEWIPWKVDHAPLFPIDTGKHAAVHDECTTCHSAAPDFSTFACGGPCHTEADVAPRHNDVGGFVYSATSCYSCHPSGIAGD